MKSKVLKGAVLSATILASASSAANAYNFNDKIYGKAQFNVGYSLQGYSGDVKDSIDLSDEMGEKVNKINHAITLGAGYNVYYKYNSFINPFVGLEAQGRIPVAGHEYVEGAKLLDVFRFNAKFGAKMNIAKDIDVQPYALLGMNVMQIKTSDDGVSDKETKAGLTTGAGVEAIFNDMFVVGAEYRFGYNKFQEAKVLTHSLGIKLGVQLF